MLARGPNFHLLGVAVPRELDSQSSRGWKQPEFVCPEFVCPEGKGGGVRNAADVGKVWCHLCSPVPPVLCGESAAECIGVGGGVWFCLPHTSVWLV